MGDNKSFSASEFADPVRRKVIVDRGATDREAADHVTDEGIARRIPQHRLGLADLLRRELARPSPHPSLRPCNNKAGFGPLACVAFLPQGR